ncbi:MAG: hypothetical protein LBS55_14415 [Prevotellaceae bacterium]|nr:hypothetical protein [Prevotellaceae bacterium]
MKYKRTNLIFIAIMAIFYFNSSVRASSDSVQVSRKLHILATKFENPPMEYRPCVWWHWLGSNIRKEGITKDLEAMKEAGIGGATIFNIASSVQVSHVPIDNNPWPHQTFRSEAYWDVFGHTLSEAKRLGLIIGLHGTPGYSTTGGPWITEEQGMQTVVSSQIKIEGNRVVEQRLERPELPVYFGYGTTFRRATYYKDIAVMAVPDKPDVTEKEVIDISKYMDANGLLKWIAPKGTWNICRIGHAPTMSTPHPLPDDIIGKALEVDKMSREHNIAHWQQLLNPIKERFGKYFGNTFDYIWIDSYESGDQNWTASFREDFTRLKGYDPLPGIALKLFVSHERDDIKRFAGDYREVVNRLFIDNGWKVASEVLHEAGLEMYWEPYGGPFNQYECVAIPDIPVDEFWTGGNGRFSSIIPRAAKQFGKRIIGAEAFTGPPMLSKYTEDPAFLKPTADGGYISGANKYWLHHWVHQPFDDKYQPGMGMGWWGTHFSRYQTWIKPGKAFFTYLARCQMLLQQGDFVAFVSKNVLHRSTPDAEIFFVINASDYPLTKSVAFPVKNRIPELWDAAKGTISKTPHWKARGDSIYVNLKLETDESVFVIFPKNKKCAYAKLKLPYIEVINETPVELEGGWNVQFNPKLSTPFNMEFPVLTDFSKHTEYAVKYFAGTADYEKIIHINADDIGKNKRTVLDLGELHDIAELTVNGKNAGVLWYPPYKADITPFLKTGDNTIVVHVTTNWANRLIGDEQHPADFEIGIDRGENGKAMKAFPDWFVENQDRPSKGRKAFTIWYYFDKNSPLYPAGLIGPVKLVKQNVKTL